MKRYPGIPELLEQFMREQGADERWVTVQELRDRFGLTRYQGNTVSGFLRRLESGPFGQFPYIVTRIEQMDGNDRSNPPKCRYLVKQKVMSGATIPGMIRQTRIRSRSASSV
ncbi:MAG: hypothetical protein WC379_16025 [Methanoregula sp.]|jgi:hypothetical protein